MKKISVLVPCYNEEENVEPLSKAIIEEIEKLKKYDYEIIFIDNCSTDKTRLKLEELCKSNKKIKTIFNIRNFGQIRSPFYGLLQTTGDCSISIAADFQEPVDMIPKFIKEWENGNKIVIGIKNKSKESPFIFLTRKIYYKMMKKLSDVPQIEQFTGFGLYDKDFINILKTIDEPIPMLRGLVAELGYNIKEINYTQEKRKAGHTKNNFFSLYDYAMLSFTSYTKAGLRLATFGGLIIAAISFIIGLIYLILKLTHWNDFSAGSAPMVISTFFFGAVQLIFLGLLGEYIMTINERVKHRPLVIEEKRINF